MREFRLGSFGSVFAFWGVICVLSTFGSLSCFTCCSSTFGALFISMSMFNYNIKIYSVCFPYGADAGRFWDQDIKDFNTNKIIHKAGDRRGMTVRLKIEEIN